MLEHGQRIRESRVTPVEHVVVGEQLDVVAARIQRHQATDLPLVGVGDEDLAGVAVDQDTGRPLADRMRPLRVEQVIDALVEQAIG